MAARSSWRDLWNATRSRPSGVRGSQSLNVERLEDRSVFAADLGGDPPASPPPDDSAIVAASATTSVSGPATADEGDALTFSGTTTAAGLLDTYEWTLTDPSGATTVLASGLVLTGIDDVTFTPPDDGDYTVTLNIYSPLDPDSPLDLTLIDSGSQSVSVDNVAPLPTIAGPTGANEAEELTYTGSFTDPAGAADGVYVYTWEARDALGNVIASANGTASAPGAVDDFTFTPPNDGSFTVSLTVAEDGTAPPADSDSLTLVVADVPPVLTVDGPTSGDRNDPVVFEGSFTDANGSGDGPFNYSWTVTGPGGFSGSANGSLAAPGDADDFSFTPTLPGDYTITFSVTDANGVTQQVVQTYSVGNPAPDVVIDAPATADEGGVVTVGAEVSDDLNDGPYTYTWQVTGPNGYTSTATGMLAAPGTVPSFDFTPPSFGDYTVSLTVVDSFGVSTTETDVVAVADVPPTPSVNGPTTGSEGSPLTFTGAISDSGAGDVYSYVWSVTGPNGYSYSTAPATTGTGAVANFTFTPPNDGEYTVTLAVVSTTNPDADEQTASQTVDAANVAPVVSVVDPAPGSQGTPVVVSGSFSDPAGTADAPYSYTWTVTGPGGFSQTVAGTVSAPGGVPDFTFTPSKSGNYTVTLTIGDDDATAGDSTTVSISNRAPNPSVGGPTEGDEGASVTFTGSFNDPGQNDDGPYAYTWTVLDSSGNVVATATGSVANSGAVPSIDFTPTNDGDYTIRLTVTDALGAGATDEQAFTAVNVAPSVTIVDPPPSNQGVPVVVNGSFSDPAGAADGPYSYTWTVTGPGGFSQTATGTVATPGAVPAFSFTPVGAGNYTVTLTVSDDDETSSDSSTVAITNTPPVPTVSGPSNGSEGSSASFQGSFSDVGLAADGPYGYTWTAYDANGNVVASASGSVAAPGTVPGFSFTPANDGSYTVRLVVTDRLGDSGTFEHAFSAANVAPTVVVTAPPAGVQGAPVSVGGSFSDPAGTADAPYSYTYTVTGPGGFSQSVSGTAASPGAIPPFVFTPVGAGDYVVTLTVADDDETSSDSTIVSVANTPPVVGVAGPASGNEGTNAAFIGSFVDLGLAADGPYSYTWTAYDSTGNVVASSSGTSAAPGAVPAFNFAAPDDGTFTIRLTVRDRLGATGSDETTFTAANVAPVPTIGGPATLDEGDSVTYTGSFTDPAGANDGPYTYTWTITDSTGAVVQTVSGSVAAPGTVPSINFTSPDDGTFTITLTVTEAGGAALGTDTLGITVENVPPAPTINGPTSFDEGDAVTYTGSFTDPAGTNDGPYRYTWTVTGPAGFTTTTSGTVSVPGTVPTFSFVAPDNGTYTVTLTVVEDAGAGVTGSASLVALGLDVPPAPSLAGPFTTTEGSAVTYTGSFTDPGRAADGPYSYTWTVTGPGGFSQTFSGSVAQPGAVADFTFTPPDDGTYTITLTVVDADGVSNTVVASQPLQTDNVAPTIGGYYFVDPVTGDRLTLVNEGQKVRLVGYFTDPGTRDTFRVVVDPRDGGGPRTIVINSPIRDADGRITFELDVLYLFPGVYNISTTVTDNNGGTAHRVTPVVVSDIPGFAVTIDPPPAVVFPLLPPVPVAVPPRIDLTVPVSTALQSAVLSGSSGTEAPIVDTSEDEIKIFVYVDRLAALGGRIVRHVSHKSFRGDQVAMLLEELRKLEPGYYRLTLNAAGTPSLVKEIEIRAEGGRKTVTDVEELWSEYRTRNAMEHFDVNFFLLRTDAQDPAEAATTPLSDGRLDGNRSAPAALRDWLAEASDEPSSIDGWRLALATSPDAISTANSNPAEATPR